MRPVLIFIHSQTNRFIASHTNPDDETRRLALRGRHQPDTWSIRRKCLKPR
jgi:hypothetical protein